MRVGRDEPPDIEGQLAGADELLLPRLKRAR